MPGLNDLWGLAMIATAGLAVLAGAAYSLLRGLGRSAGWAGWGVAAGAVGFLVAAGVGTVVQVGATSIATEDRAPAQAVQASDSARPPAMQNGQEAAEPQPRAHASAKADAKPAQPEDGATAAAAPSATQIPSVPAPPGLDLDGAVALATKTAHRTCKRPLSVAKAWAGLLAQPVDGESRPRLESAAAKLDKCRSKVRSSLGYQLQRERAASRETYKKALNRRLRTEYKLTPKVVLSGKARDRLRVGGGRIDETLVTEVIDAAAQRELTERGFTLVVFANNSQTWKFPLTPRSEAEYVGDKMQALGLHEPLTIR